MDLNQNTEFDPNKQEPSINTAENVVNEKENFKFADAGAAFLFSFLSLIAVTVFYAIIYAARNLNQIMDDAESISQSAGDIILSGILTQVAFILAYIIFCRSKNKNLSAGGLKKAKLDICLVAVVLTIAGLFCFGFIATLWDELLIMMGYKSQNPLAGIEISSQDIFGFIIAIGILPAIGEELLFRGMILHSLNRRCSESMSIIISAGLFSVFHMSPDQTVYQFFLGLMMGYITLRTKSILPAMIMHATNNLFGVLMAFLNFSINPPMHIAALIPISVILMIVALVGIPYVIDRLCGSMHKNYFYSLFVLERNYSAGTGSYLKNATGSNKYVELMEQRKAYLNDQAKKLDYIEPEYIPPEPSFMTGNSDYDAVVLGQHEAHKKGLLQKRKNAYFRSNAILVGGFLLCLAFWVVAFIQGFYA